MRCLRGIRFYAKIDWDGKIQLPPDFLDRVEDVKHPVGSEVFVYVKLKE